MTHRYYVPELPTDGGTLPLPADEAHHARSVMRVRPGDSIELFNGQGWIAQASIEHVEKRQVTCSVEPPRQESRLPRRQVVLGIGLPKGDRAKFLIEKLTEMGVLRCIPLNCQRSQWTPSAAAIEKWRRAMIEACKQSGRNHLMDIDSPIRSLDWLSQAGEDNPHRLLAHPDAARAVDASDRPRHTWSELHARPDLHLDSDRPQWIAIGPEGGFTSDEVTAAKSAGWQTIDLGQLVYRIETAAITMAALAIHQ